MVFQYSVQEIGNEIFKYSWIVSHCQNEFYDSRLLTASYCIAFVIVIYSPVIALSWRGTLIYSKQLNRVTENDP
jgi:hypothetical protein